VRSARDAAAHAVSHPRYRDRGGGGGAGALQVKERAFCDTPFGIELTSLHALIDSALITALDDGASPLAAQYVSNSGEIARACAVSTQLTRCVHSYVIVCACEIDGAHTVIVPTLGADVCRASSQVAELRLRRLQPVSVRGGLVGLDVESLLAPLLGYLRTAFALDATRAVVVVGEPAHAPALAPPLLHEAVRSALALSDWLEAAMVCAHAHADTMHRFNVAQFTWLRDTLVIVLRAAVDADDALVICGD
jgi:hypothetical protein